MASCSSGACVLRASNVTHTFSVFGSAITSFHALDFHQRLAQRAHTFVAIVACGRDVDSFPNGLVGGVVQIMRIGWVHVKCSRLGTSPDVMNFCAADSPGPARYWPRGFSGRGHLDGSSR